MPTILETLRAQLDTTGSTIAEALGGSGTIAEALGGSKGGAAYGTAYIVSFSANGGSGTIDPVAVAAGSKLTLPDDTDLTPPSQKQFVGWFTASSLGEGDEAIEAGTKVTVDDDTTFYAIWGD